MRNSLNNLFLLGIVTIITAIATYAALVAGIFFPTTTFLICALGSALFSTLTYLAISSNSNNICSSLAIASGFLAIVTALFLLLTVATATILELGTVLLIIFIIFLYGGIWCSLTTTH